MVPEQNEADNQTLKIIQGDGSIDVELLMNTLGNEIDRKILMKLAKTPRIATNLSKDLGISKPAIKKHLERIERVYESNEMQLNVPNFVDKVYNEDFIAELPNA